MSDAQVKEPLQWDGKFAPGSMYDGSSPLSAAQAILYEQLVPASGMCETTRGEALRAVCKLYHDCYNNGGINFQNYPDHHVFLRLFLEQWLTNDGPVNIVTVTAAYEVLVAAHKKAEKAEDDYGKWEQRESRDGFETDEPPAWDALEDKGYLSALELMIHWVTWKVARLNDGV